jgi:hypothetical protein
MSIRGTVSGLVALTVVIAACGDDSASPSGGGGAGAGSGVSTGATSSSPTPSSSGPGSGSSGDPSAGGGDATPASSGAGASSGSGGEGGGIGPSNPDCEPLPAASGDIIEVGPDEDLPSIAGGAAAGTTIVLTPGTYAIGATIQLRNDGVTLRSSTDDPADVEIDAGYAIPEAIAISASDVTVAHVTVTHAIDHLVHVYPPAAGIDVLRPRFHGLRLVDGGEQFIKVNPIGGQDGWIDDGEIACSTFLMTDEGRPNVEPCCGGCYTGGIDVHAGQGWSVHDNHFEGIHCEGGGLPEHAIHFWKGSKDTLVERNTVIDCGRGIGLGLGGGGGERVYDGLPEGLAHYGGIVRGNVIFADIPWFDTGIEIHEASAPIVVHNSVYATENATGFFSSIDYRFPTTTVTIMNNVVQRISMRDDAQGDAQSNIEDATPDLFIDAEAGDLHLAPGAAAAIDTALFHEDAGLDIDGETRDVGNGADMGADERQ